MCNTDESQSQAKKKRTHSMIPFIKFLENAN